MLTTDADVFVGVSGGDDTITATSATIGADGDILVDGSSTDNDTLTITATAAIANTDFTVVSGIENINVDWNSFAAAVVSMQDMRSTTLTISSSKVGYLGNATINDVDTNTVVFGTNVDGTLDVNDVTNGSVTATEGGALTVDGTGTAADDEAVSVTGGRTITVGATNPFIATTVTADSTTVTISAAGQGEDSTITITDGAATTQITADTAQTVVINSTNAATIIAKGDTGGGSDSSLTVSATAADDIELVGAGGTDTAVVTTNESVVTLDLDTGLIESITLNVADGAEVTLETGAELDELTVASAGSVTLVADSGDLDGHTVTNSTAGLVVDLTSSGADDLDTVSATSFNLVTSSAHALIFAKTVTVNVDGDVDVNAAQVFDGTGAVATTGTITLNIAGDQGTITTTDFGSTVINASYDADGEATDTDDDMITFGTLDPESDLTLVADADTIITSIAAATDDVILSVAGTLEVTGVVAGTLDLSGTTGATDITDSGDADFTVVGGQAANDITFAATTNNVVYTGSTAVDAITLATTDGAATLSLSDGNNTVNAATLVGGTLVVVSGSGNDSVTLGAAMTIAEATLELGAGNNTVTLSDAAGVGNLTIVTGDGNDTIVLADTFDAAESWSFTLGGGTNTLDLSNAANVDIDSVDLTISGLNLIKFNTSGDVVNADLLDDQAIEIRGDGNISDLLTVTVDSAGTYDFSNITINSTLTLGAGGLAVTATAVTTATSATLSAGDDSYAGGSGADTVVGGAGDNTITGNSGADVITTGLGSDIVVITDEATADTVTDFSVDDDIIQIDVSAIGSNAVDGSATALAAGTPTLQSQESTDGTDIAATTDILVFENTLANAAAVKAAVELLSVTSGGNVADNDDIFVMWTDGSDTYLSSVDIAVTGEAIDTATVSNMVKLTGVAIADVAAANIAFI